ncbi:MAG: dihydroorotase [Maribacter sp.]
MNILLKAATIVDQNNKKFHLKKRDIFIKNGIIDEIAPKIDVSSKVKTIESKGLHVSAGWFDSSVSFGEPGFEERETISNGLHTAAKNGFTDVVLNPNTYPVPDSSAAIVFLKNAAQSSATRLHPLGTLTADSKGIDLAELYDMQGAGAVGFYDFKHPVKNANLLKIALQYAQNFDGLVHSFPLDTQIAGKGVVNEGEVSTRIGLKGIPALAEELQIARDLFILEYTGGKLHIPTISTANAVKLIAEGKKKGLNVSCSVAWHNLYFTDETLSDFNTDFKVLPPLRTKKDTKALIEGVKKGTIDYVTSDHTPLNIELKQVEFDNAAYGSLGFESAFGIAQQLFDLETTIALLTKGRERYGVAMPSIAEGTEANLTLFEPNSSYMFKKEHITSSSKNSMFLNTAMKGSVLGVICNGQVII